MQVRIMLAAVVASLALGALAAGQASAASVVRCSGHQYGAIDRSAFRSISNLRAVNPPRKTDGYAPRCLVAESVAAMVQSWASDHMGHIPRTVEPMGARWDGRTWRIRWQMINDAQGDPYAVFTATRGRQYVMFDGAS
jgi:hypothetical protein